MTKALFVDTNVILYLNDPRDPRKREIARHWLAALAARELIVISPQVMNEFAYTTLRKFPATSRAELMRLLDAMMPWCRAQLTGQTCLDALALHGRFHFSFFDSTLLAAALAYGCEVFLSEDLASGQRIGDLTILNPFTTAVETVLTT
jgi:predicted nucleic acid-binding protein